MRACVDASVYSLSLELLCYHDVTFLNNKRGGWGVRNCSSVSPVFICKVV